mgnify:FL=1
MHEITIIPRGQAGGYTMYLPEKDRSYVTKGEMFEDIVSSLGGRVAEQLILDDISTGASNDLQQATNIARQMITKYGFSERLGPVVYGTSQKLAIRKEILQAVSEQFEASVTAVDSGIRRMVDQLEARPGPAWLAFKADTGLGSGKPTTGKLIYAVRSAVLRQKTDK